MMREEFRVGLQYLDAATTLLRRIRKAHATAGLLEAADLHWWWRAPRTTDTHRQLFWFDDQGCPQAAVIATDWGDGIALDPIVMPDATPDQLAHIVERGLAHANASGFESVEFVVDHADAAMRKTLAGLGYAVEDGAAQASPAGLSVTTAWLSADAGPGISPLHEGYRLLSRVDRMQLPHHMIPRNGPDLEMRLRQTSLYRPDLDLLVLDPRDNVAAYALFWFDPETATGLVEPMRTEADHQRRGLARHLLTAGIDRLAKAGAARIKLCFKPDNVAARCLYLGVGFTPDKQTVMVTRRAAAGAS